MEEIQKQTEELLAKDSLSLDERVKLFDCLYWADWDELDKDYSKKIDSIFSYIKTGNPKEEEIAKILALYNNLDGAHIEEFAKLIAGLYEKDRIKFLRSLNLNKEEAINLVYVFKIIEVFEDGDEEFQEISSLDKLNEEELDTAKGFFNMYKTICNT